MWLGLLFSILAITMLSYHQFDNEPPEYEGRTEAIYEQYRLRTAQCLMIGDIAKCLPYTLETLLLNSTTELARKDDNSRGLWMMTGLILRCAINMGYHRDPSQTSSISVLQGELRRRVWLAITHKDDLASFLVGFPSMMPATYSDTQEPRNLHDWELSDDMTVLPPPRSYRNSICSIEAPVAIWLCSESGSALTLCSFMSAGRCSNASCNERSSSSSLS